jgi:hypothetical protein
MTNQIYKTLLEDKLKEKPCYLEFRKVDGTMRQMLATRNSALIAKTAPARDENALKSTRAQSEDVIKVYDLGKKAWRSFKVNNLKMVENVDTLVKF